MSGSLAILSTYKWNYQMIKLYGFGSAFGLVDPSPFVAKVDAFLRLSGLPYELVNDFSAFRRAPKGKLPMIEDDGQIIPDSYFICEYLQDKYQLTIDQDLTEEQRGVAHLLTKSLDENFYWFVVYSRWIREDTWPIISKAFFSKMPIPMRYIVPIIARSGVKSALKKQGIGRHTEDEMLQIFEHSLKSLASMLGNKKYFFGDKVSSFDATAFAFLSSFILADFDNPFYERAKRYSTLVDFCNRFKLEYY